MLFLFFFGVFLSAVTGVIFIVKGFKVHVGWGLAMIFVPLTPLAFAVKYWERCWLTFCVGMIGTLMFVGAGMSGGTAILQAQMHAGGASPEEIASLDLYRTGSFAEDLAAAERREAMLTGAVTEEVQEQEAESEDESERSEERQAVESAPQRKAVKYGYRDVNQEDLPAHLFSNLKVESTNGRVREGKLLAVNNGVLTLQVRLGTGSMEFKVPGREIKKVQLWSQISG